MGLTEKERETMYLVLFLLIAPALGRPSSAQPDDVDKLDDMNKFNNQLGELLKDSRLFGAVVEDLDAAKQNVLDIEDDLRFLRTKIRGLQYRDNYIEQFNQAIVYVNQTRLDLRKLAVRTVTEAKALTPLLQQIDRKHEQREKIPDVALLLDSFDINADDPAALKSLIEKMKGLMIETKERLEEAVGKYQRAHEVFENLIDYAEVNKNAVIGGEKELKEKYKKDKAYTEKVRNICAAVSFFTFGLCSLIHHFENEVPLERDRIKLANLKSKTVDFLGRVKT